MLAHWNYRVVKMNTNGEEQFVVCEVYYDGEGLPQAYARDKNVLDGDSYEELVSMYERIASAFAKPLLVTDSEGRLREYAKDRPTHDA